MPSATALYVAIQLMQLQPFQIKLAARKEDEVQAVVSVYRIQSKGESLGAVAVRKLNDLVNDAIASVGWRKAYVNRVCFDVRTAADRDAAEPFFVKMHIVKFHSDIISDIADGIPVDGKHIPGDITAVGSIQPCIGFFYFGEVEALQGHFHFWIYNDGDGLNAFQSF